MRNSQNIAQSMAVFVPRADDLGAKPIPVPLGKTSSLSQTSLIHQCGYIFIRFALFLSLLILPHSAQAITITITGLGSMSPSQQTAFNDAKAFWENLLVGYQEASLASVDGGPTINAIIAPDDGPGGTLGSASPDFFAPSANFIYTYEGSMEFDSADVPGLELAGIFGDVIRHEMGHVLGVGTAWSGTTAVGFGGFQEFYVTNSFEFTGPEAIAKYQLEFNQPGATFVPVEDNGGPGTANGHWDEQNGGSGPTGVTDTQGRDRRFELMTGWLNNPTFISNTTIASMSDLGYVVNYLNDSRITAPGGSINFGSAIVGSSPSQNIMLSKTGAETTTYSLTPDNNGLTSSATGSFVAGTDSEIVALSLATNANGSGTTGNKSINFTIDNLATDNNGSTVGNNDANEVRTANAVILDASQASFNSVSDQNALVLNFGSVLQNSSPVDLPFSLFNLENTAGFTAALDLLSINGSGDTSKLTTNLSTFTELAAGSSNAYLASIDTSSIGSFSATYLLDVADDQNVFGFGSGTQLELTINGSIFALSGGVVPEPSSLTLAAFGLLGLLRRRRSNQVA